MLSVSISFEKKYNSHVMVRSHQNLAVVSANDSVSLLSMVLFTLHFVIASATAFSHRHQLQMGWYSFLGLAVSANTVQSI